MFEYSWNYCASNEIHTHNTMNWMLPTFDMLIHMWVSDNVTNVSSNFKIVVFFPSSFHYLSSASAVLFHSLCLSVGLQRDITIETIITITKFFVCCVTNFRVTSNHYFIIIFSKIYLHPTYEYSANFAFHWLLCWAQIDVCHIFDYVILLFVLTIQKMYHNIWFCFICFAE